MTEDPNGLSQQDISDLQEIAKRLPPNDPRLGKIQALLGNSSAPDYSHPTPAMLRAAALRSAQPTQMEQEQNKSTGLLDTAVGGIKKLYGMASGAVKTAYAVDQARQGNALPLTDIAINTSDAIQKANAATPPETRISVPSSDPRFGMPMLGTGLTFGDIQNVPTNPTERPAMVAGAALGADTPALAAAARRGDAGGMLVESTPLLAQAAMPAVIRKLAGVDPNAPIPKDTAASNLHNAAMQGGSAGTIDLFNDVAKPGLEPLQRAIADEGLTPADFQGRQGPLNAIKSANRVVQNAEAKMGPAKAMVENLPAGQIASEAASQIRAQASGTLRQAFPEIAQKFDAMADRVASAKTYGDLLRIKSELNDMTASFWKKSTSDQGSVAAGMEAAVDAGNIIRAKVYPRMSELTGTDIGALMKEEGTGLQLRTQFEKANPKIQADISSTDSTSWTQRVKGSKSGGEALRNLIDVGPLAKPTLADVFGSNMSRVARGAKPSNFELLMRQRLFPQDQPFTNPLGPPNPGTGPYNAPASTEPNNGFGLLEALRRR